MRAVIYARCSTEEESQKDALINQVKEAKECVKRMDWMLVDTYIESRSGTTTKGRAEYNRLYDDLQYKGLVSFCGSSLYEWKETLYLYRK